MKTITRWDHLSEFGIVPLTGESCGLGYRMLCDVTAKGKTSWKNASAFRTCNLPDNWNQGSEAEPHVGSIMLAPELLVPHRCLRSSGERLQGGLEGREPGGAWHPVSVIRRIPPSPSRNGSASRACAGLPIGARPATATSHLMSGRVQ